MLVAMVTPRYRPAWAMMDASASWLTALSTLCLIFFFLSIWEISSDFSTVTVPTSTGCPLAWDSAISSTTASYFSRWVRYTTSAWSSRTMGRWVGTTTTSRS